MRSSGTLLNFVVCFLLSTNALMAQIPGMKVYTSLDGFPGAIGYRVHQDARGFIWIGTDNGVACFDGRQFEVFNASDGMVDKEVIIALPDLDSTVLFMPLLNNYSYYRNGRVVTAKQNPQLNKIQNTNLNRVFMDHATGQLWIGDASHTHLYRLQGDSIEVVETTHIPENFDPLWVHARKLFHTHQQSDMNRPLLYRYDLQNHANTRMEVLDNSGPLDAHRITMNTDASLCATVSLETGLVAVYSVMEEGLRLVMRFEPTFAVDRTVIDKNNHLWLLLQDGGVTYVGPVGNAPTPAKTFTFLRKTLINDLFMDRDGHIWITTRFKGLHFLSARHWANALTTQPLRLPDAVPQRLVEDKEGHLLLSYYHDPVLSQIRKNNSALVHYNPRAKDGFRCILETERGLILASNYLLEWLQKQNGAWQTTHFDDTLGSIKDLVLDPAGNPLIASSHGAQRCFLPRQGSHELPSYEKVFGGRTSCISSFGDSSILIGTPNGIHYLKGTQSPQAVNHPLLSTANITDIAPITSTALLIGTNAQGLFWYEPFAENIHHLLVPEKLDNSHIRHIHVQADTSFWLATDNGIFHVLLNARHTPKRVDRYTFFDGLPSNNVSDMLVQNDTIYAATSAGLGIIPARTSLIRSAEPPRTWITAAHTGGRTIHFPDRLEMNYQGNDFVLALSAISYESFNRISYRYRLDNWSPRWMETDGSEISFSNLPPGSYTLQVQALNFAGIAGPLSTLDVDILPAFWQTWWFQVLCALVALLLLAGLIYLWARRYRTRVELETQRKKQLALLELEAIKAQINPHFISNCLNSIQYLHLKQDYDRATQYFNLFAKLIHHTLEYSQETLITLDQEVDYLHNYLELEKIRFKDGMTYHIEADEALNRSLLLPAMLIQPYVENALKHGITANEGLGVIEVRFAAHRQDGIRVTITDDGPGMEEGFEHSEQKRLGLRLSKSRATTYQQLFDCIIDIAIQNRKDQSPPARGTQVILHIPSFNHAKTRTERNHY